GGGGGGGGRGGGRGAARPGGWPPGTGRRGRRVQTAPAGPAQTPGKATTLPGLLIPKRYQSASALASRAAYKLRAKEASDETYPRMASHRGAPQGTPRLHVEHWGSRCRPGRGRRRLRQV